jgi:ABC-type protease/lipase transport system fused ATPase/permease subunit
MNGSGKTALLHILGGSLTGWSGGVAFDCYSLRDLDLMNLHLQVGNYFMDAKLFGGTILENISLGRFETTTDDVMAAIRIVGLEEFVLQLPNGLNTEIASGANHFSSGVTCKMLIARCIVHRPRLILLDSFFAALDFGEPIRGRLCSSLPIRKSCNDLVVLFCCMKENLQQMPIGMLSVNIHIGLINSIRFKHDGKQSVRHS